MAAFKNPTFEDRAASARQAKERALEKLRAKPTVDPEATAARAAAAQAKDAAAAQRREAHRAAIEAEKVAKAEARELARLQAEEAAERAAALRRPAPAPVLPTAEEMKAARDARYAARKARKK